jgi:vitamin B12 transporter
MATCALAVAFDATASDISPTDTIIVTATRTEIPLDQATVPVSVITREDIELSMATDLSELLRFEAGIDIGRNGGPGQATSMFLRGTESNHALVLVDGVRMNPGTIGSAAIQHVSPEVIERVEIVKGARSALFGTDAIGGVINIITRRANESSFEAGAGGGSFDSRSAFVSAGTRKGSNRFGATVDWQDTAGFPPREDSDIDRGYDNLTFNLYVARDLDRGEVSVRHWQAEGTVEYLDFFLNPVDQGFRNSTTALQFDNELSDRGASKLVIGYMQDHIEQNQSPDFVESDRLSIDWQTKRQNRCHSAPGSTRTPKSGRSSSRTSGRTIATVPSSRCALPIMIRSATRPPTTSNTRMNLRTPGHCVPALAGRFAHLMRPTASASAATLT